MLRPLLLPLAALGSSSAGWGYGPADEVCNLGGRLVEGRCQCYPTFAGPHCAQLNLLPARTSWALFRESSSSWGGTVRRGRDGRHHMYFSNILGHCGLRSWECNSAIAHAVAPGGSPEGPYEVSETILPPFAHNPTLQVHEGKWIIYHIGSGKRYKPEMACSQGVTNGTCGASSLEEESSGLVDEDPGLPNILVSEGPHGPWTALAGDGHWALNNPTAYVHENGTTLMIYKVGCNATVNPEGRFCRQFALATSESWRGPFKLHSRLELFGEDAHVWRCPFTGTFHFLFQGGSYTPALPQWPGHFHMAFSRDGLSDWRIAGGAGIVTSYQRRAGFYLAHPSPANDTVARGVSASQRRCNQLGSKCAGFTCGTNEQACTLRTGHDLVGSSSGVVSYLKSSAPDTMAFSASIDLVNGTRVTYARRERHQLLLNEDGAPSHLFNGATDGRGDHSLTAVQPIATGRPSGPMVYL